MRNAKSITKTARKWLKAQLGQLMTQVKGSRFEARTHLVSRLEGVQKFVTRDLMARLRPSRRRVVGDERAMRRAAEQELGGMSSAEAAEKFARGEIKGGTHGGKAVHFEGVEHERPSIYEPTARIERHPHGETHMAERRSG
jgi:hypothetical protein